jgi:hypothetical protein
MKTTVRSKKTVSRTPPTSHARAASSTAVAHAASARQKVSGSVIHSAPAQPTVKRAPVAEHRTARTRHERSVKSVLTVSRQPSGRSLERLTAARPAQSGPAAAKSAKNALPKAECIHHWVIEPPNGAVSAGKCRLCGERRDFRNSYEYSSWYGSKSAPARQSA